MAQEEVIPFFNNVTTRTENARRTCDRERINELVWTDVAVHPWTVLTALEQVACVSCFQLEYDAVQLDYGRRDGHRLVLVPDDIAALIGSLTDLHGESFIDPDGDPDRWSDSSAFQFVHATHLRPAAQRIVLRGDRRTDPSACRVIRCDSRHLDKVGDTGVVLGHGLSPGSNTFPLRCFQFWGDL